MTERSWLLAPDKDTGSPPYALHSKDHEPRKDKSASVSQRLA